MAAAYRRRARVPKVEAQNLEHPGRARLLERTATLNLRSRLLVGTACVGAFACGSSNNSGNPAASTTTPVSSVTPPPVVTPSTPPTVTPPTGNPPTVTPSVTPPAPVTPNPTPPATPPSGDPPPATPPPPPAIPPSNPPPAATGDCVFTISDEMSARIATVAAVEWSVAAGTVSEAHIEFGLDTSYGMTAPVDVMEPNLRTLLLGMKPSQTYNYRIVATVDGKECSSENRTVTTGAQSTALVEPEVTVAAADKHYGGYMYSTKWGTGNDGPAWIMDKDNEYVWWYVDPMIDDVFRTRMSVDGKYMWMRNTGQTAGSGALLRITMDGLHEDRWDDEIALSTHDFAVMADGRIGLILWDSDASMRCAEIAIFDPKDASVTPIFNARDAHGSTSCHVNNIQYYADDDTFTFSDYETDCYVKIKSSGELVWVLNGPASDFTGTDWKRQHGLHYLSENHLMVFSNGDIGEATKVFELQLNTEAMTAEVIWSYEGGPSTPFGGDVQRLPNGNTLVAYSSTGEIHEVDAQGQLVQKMVWPAKNPVGYTTVQDSLYTESPRLRRVDP